MKAELASKVYEDFLKKRKVHFNPKRRTAKEQNNHIMSLHLKKYIAKEKLEIKYEEKKKPKIYPFQPKINYNSREIARDIRRTSKSIESISRKTSSKSRDLLLLTTARSKSNKRRFFKSPAIINQSRSSKSRVVFRHDGGVWYPGDSETFREITTSSRMNSSLDNLRRDSLYERKKRRTSRSVKRRERYGEKPHTSRPKRKYSSRSKSHKSGIISSRDKSLSKLVRFSRKHSLYSNPRNSRKTSLNNSNIDLDTIEFVESSTDKLYLKKKRKSRTPFNDIIESSNRLHSKAREYEEKKRQAKKDSLVDMFKPKLNTQKEMCKQSVKRLIHVLDMRFNKLNRVNKENLNQVQMEQKINHQKISKNLQKSGRRMF